MIKKLSRAKKEKLIIKIKYKNHLTWKVEQSQYQYNFIQIDSFKH